MKKRILVVALLVLQAAGGAVASPGSYRVKRGDNLFKIGRRFGVSPHALRRANGLRSDRLSPGDVLRLPSTAERGSPRATLPSREPSSARVAAPNVEGPELSAAERLLQFAKRMLDVPYRFGGNSLRGIDCSAYVRRVFAFLNIRLPRTAREQFRRGRQVPREELAAGDLVFFETYADFPSHVGIYVGANRFIHASSRGKRVTVDSLEDSFYESRFIGARRLLPEPGDAEGVG